LLLGICFWREAPETAVGADRRAGKRGLVDPVGDDRRAADLHPALEQDHLRALGGYGLTDLVADHAVERVIGSRREGTGNPFDEQQTGKDQVGGSAEQGHF
jgi:hypothetical protein